MTDFFFLQDEIAKGFKDGPVHALVFALGLSKCLAQACKPWNFFLFALEMHN